MNAHPAMSHEERARLRAAASGARQVYGGSVGELLSRELLSWEEFGYRLGSRTMMMGIVDAVLNVPNQRAEAA